MKYADLVELLSEGVTGLSPTFTHTYVPRCDKTSFMPEEGGFCGWCGFLYEAHPEPYPSMTMEITDDGFTLTVEPE